MKPFMSFFTNASPRPALLPILSDMRGPRKGTKDYDGKDGRIQDKLLWEQMLWYLTKSELEAWRWFVHCGLLGGTTLWLAWQAWLQSGYRSLSVGLGSLLGAWSALSPDPWTWWPCHGPSCWNGVEILFMEITYEGLLMFNLYFNDKDRHCQVFQLKLTSVLSTLSKRPFV